MPEIDRWMEPLLAGEKYFIEVQADEVPRVVVSVDGVERPAFEYVGGMWVELHQEGADLPPKYEELTYYTVEAEYDLDGVKIPFGIKLVGDSMAQLVSEIHPTEKYVQEVLGPQYITSAWHLYTEMEGNEDVTREEFVERLKAGATDPSKRVVLKVAYVAGNGAVVERTFDPLSGAWFVRVAEGDQEQLKLSIDLGDTMVSGGDGETYKNLVDLQYFGGRLVAVSVVDEDMWRDNLGIYAEQGRTPELSATFDATTAPIVMLSLWGCLPYGEMSASPSRAVLSRMAKGWDAGSLEVIRSSGGAVLNVPGATETDLMRVVLP